VVDRHASNPADASVSEPADVGLTAGDRESIRSRGSAFSRTELLGLLGTCAGCAVFLSLWWNRAIGLTLDGYFLVFGSKIATGHVPYRDFFLYVPPLEPLLNALLYSAFGAALIAPRLLGIVLRLALAGLLFVWMRDVARSSVATLAVITGVVLASGNTTEILLLYNMDSILWAVLAGWSLSRALSKERGVFGWAAVGGVGAALCLWTKQTTGLVFLSALLGVLLFVWSCHRGESRWRRLWLGLSLGFGIPTAAMVTWLFSTHALGLAIQDTLLLGPEMKGSVLAEVPRFVTNSFRDLHFAVPAALGLLGAVVAASTTRLRLKTVDASPDRSRLVWWTAATLAALAVGVLLAWSCGTRLIGLARLPQRALTYMGVVFAAALAVRLMWLAWRRGLTGSQRSVLLMTTVSLSVAFALSLSWGFNEPIVIPGGVLALAMLLESTFGTSSSSPRRRGAVVVGCWVCLAMATWARLAIPYDFAGWQEPSVLAARGRSEIEALNGFRLSASTAQAIDIANGAVQRWTRPNDGLVTFPDIPIFHLMSGRPSAMFASVQWFDVCPDRVLLGDLGRLEKNPPAAILELVLTEEDITAHEVAFRGGRPSALRRMWGALHRLERARYRRVASIRPTNRDSRPLEVWIRKDRL